MTIKKEKEKNFEIMEKYGIDHFNLIPVIFHPLIITGSSFSMVCLLLGYIFTF